MWVLPTHIKPLAHKIAWPGAWHQSAPNARRYVTRSVRQRLEPRQAARFLTFPGCLAPNRTRGERLGHVFVTGRRRGKPASALRRDGQTRRRRMAAATWPRLACRLRAAPRGQPLSPRRFGLPSRLRERSRHPRKPPGWRTTTRRGSDPTTWPARPSRSRGTSAPASPRLRTRLPGRGRESGTGRVGAGRLGDLKPGRPRRRR